MMRYQKISPFCLPSSDGKKHNSKSYKEDELSGTQVSNYCISERKGLRVSSISSPPKAHALNFSTFSAPFTICSTLGSENETSKNVNSPESTLGGDVLLQWGRRKRLRGSRHENKTISVVESAVAKGQRKVVKSGEASSGVTNLIPSVPVSDNQPLVLERNSEYLTASAKSSPSKIHAETIDKQCDTLPDKSDKMISYYVAATEPSTLCEPEDNGGPKERRTSEKVSLPKIYLSLTRKEKEEDFLAMKGTKIPQRPKKRAKNVDKILQYVFPGMWLSEISRSRYEVREKKCDKKKRRSPGLKGMDVESSE